MSQLNITSANSSLRFITPIFPGGFTVEDYSVDAMFQAAPVTNKEVNIGADGKMHAGYVFNTKEFTINLSATSPTIGYLDQIWTYENTGILVLPINGVLSIPALDGSWNLVNGVISTWAAAPSAGKVLQPRQAVFTFENITPA